MSSLLLSLPEELLELVVFESDTPTRKALRSTCLRLELIATPLVFESLLIDIRNRHHVSKFLRNLCSSKGLARYVQHIHLVSLKAPRKLLLLRRGKEWRNLLIAAIPHMTSLKSISCSASDKRILTNTTLWHSLSHIDSLTISNCNGKQRKSTARLHLPDLTCLSFSGYGCLEYANTLISTSTHLKTLAVRHPLHPDDRFDPFSPSVLILFRGPQSMCLTTLSLSGNLSLSAAEVPFLIPYIRHLQSLSLDMDFVPGDFWQSLKQEEIFVKERFALTTWDAEPSVFDYLCSYTGLRHLFLHIKEGQDGHGVRKVVKRHRKSLCDVDIKPNVQVIA
ncbi:uncharacterized protein BT62DRAFT_928689 [Guyanagaster necrorhizus]|uniref:F-box domain-containing protein n=1 Tax=Guyanagaster necrorhizus TaxID=856835 RepID=A0A9P7W207_9AGAR|nr:uncharacterized protein BT62DRAFT_928689 [Guyanagaster necrorhizus MCA 3950]KAG7449921.1 hypothetical protein BT62DRAFT_928689 [Guyanagaster necrorhizus MCA 3950]